MEVKVGCLEEELQGARLCLVSLNESIRRVIGSTTLRNDDAFVGDIQITDNQRACQKSLTKRTTKRRATDIKSVFNRLSVPTKAEDNEIRPRINSRVIRELPTRQEVVAAQGTDSESKARNKRMFSSLLGTLQKFCQEESRLREKEDKKAQIEKKLEEQEVQERETLKKNREMLFMERKRKQMEIKFLELKVNRLKDYEIWKASLTCLNQHIRTKTKPHIYFRPRSFSKKTDKLLLQSQKEIDFLKKSKEKDVYNDICKLEEELKVKIEANCLNAFKKCNEDIGTKQYFFENDSLSLKLLHDKGKQSNELNKESPTAAVVLIKQENEKEEL